MIPLDSQINVVLQTFLGDGALIRAFMDLLSQVGSVISLTLLVAFVYWCVDTRLGIRLGITLLISNNIYSVLKLAFHSPRPYWVDPNVKAWAAEPSFGFPSGHSMMSASVWGIFSLSTRKRRWIAGAFFLIFLIGISRMYLGVHFLADVLAGWSLGFVLLVLIYTLEKPATTWINRERPGLVFLASAAIGIVFIALGYFFYIKLVPWQFPSGWLAEFEPAIHPVMMRDIVESAGIFIGFAGGTCWLRTLTATLGIFNPHGTGPQMVWRCMVGIAGILFLYGSLGLVVPHGETIAAWVVQCVRSGLTGFWISGLAPFIFIKTGLAEGK
jgi:membrane-associated phospholipid phosphatase